MNSWKTGKRRIPNPDVVSTSACKQLRVAFTEAQRFALRPVLTRHHRVRDTRARFTRRLARGTTYQRDDELLEDGPEYIQPGAAPRFHLLSNDERWHAARPGIEQQYYTHRERNDLEPARRAAARAQGWLQSEKLGRPSCCHVHSQQVLVITLECSFKVHLRYTTCTR